MIAVNISSETIVPLIVGVGSTILALLLMLIKIPRSDYSSKLSNSKLAIVVSFLICSFMMFYSLSQHDKAYIWDWQLYMMLSIYIVVHFSTSIISYSMIGLLKTEKTKWANLFAPGLFISVIIAFLLLESYKSGDVRYFWTICVIALTAFLIQSVTYIINFDRTYHQSLRDLENYYDEDESDKLQWVRFCYVIAMLTNAFVLVYIVFYFVFDFKLIVASIYTLWYLLYMLYLTSNFISFIGSHKLILDAFAHSVLSGKDIINMINENKKKRGKAPAVVSTINKAEFKKLEAALELWVEKKKYTEYDKSREEIARELNTTKESLHQYFTHRKGMDFKTWRTRLRIEEAKRLMLANKDASTNIIAEVSGFSDRSNFHKQFVKFVGCSPKEWRERNGAL